MFNTFRPWHTDFDVKKKKTICIPKPLLIFSIPIIVKISDPNIKSIKSTHFDKYNLEIDLDKSIKPKTEDSFFF